MTTVLDLLFPNGAKITCSALPSAESAESAESEQWCGLQSPQPVAESCGKPADGDGIRNIPQASADAGAPINSSFPQNPHNPHGGASDSEIFSPAIPVTLEWLREQGCAVLPGDLELIKRCLPSGTVRRNAILWAYVRTWHAAMEQEPNLHRKDNRGRFTANTALREGKLSTP